MFVFYLAVPLLYIADYWLNIVISNNSVKEEKFMKKSTYFIYKKGEFLNMTREKRDHAYRIERVFIVPFFILISAMSILSYMLIPVNLVYAAGTCILEFIVRLFGDLLVREQMKKII